MVTVKSLVELLELLNLVVKVVIEVGLRFGRDGKVAQVRGCDRLVVPSDVFLDPQ